METRPLDLTALTDECYVALNHRKNCRVTNPERTSYNVHIFVNKLQVLFGGYFSEAYLMDAAGNG